MSAFSYEVLLPYAPTLALAALSHCDEEVREGGIRAFEQWGHPSGINILRYTKTSWKWLEDYRLQTIAYLESIQ